METPYLMEELYLVQDDVRDMKTKLEIIGNETGGLQDEYGKCEPPEPDAGDSSFIDPCASLPPSGEEATNDNCDNINSWCAMTVEGDNLPICKAKYGDNTDSGEWCNEEYETAGGIVRSACPNICEYVKEGERVRGTGEDIEVFQRVDNYIGRGIDGAIQEEIDGRTGDNSIEIRVNNAIGAALLEDRGQIQGAISATSVEQVDQALNNALEDATIASRLGNLLDNTEVGSCVEVDSTDEWLSEEITRMSSDTTLLANSPFQDLLPETEVYDAYSLNSGSAGVPINPSLCVLMSGEENRANCDDHPGCIMPQGYFKEGAASCESTAAGDQAGDPDFDACASVVALDDSTACLAVQLAAGGGSACTYTDADAPGRYQYIDNSEHLCLSNGLPEESGSEDDECTRTFNQRGPYFIQNCPFTCKYQSGMPGSTPLQGELGMTEEYRLP